MSLHLHSHRLCQSNCHLSILLNIHWPLNLNRKKPLVVEDSHMISWHADDSCVALLSCNLYPLLPASLIWGFLRPILCEELRCGNIFPKQVHPPTNVKNYIISINIRMSKPVTTKAQWLRPGKQFSFSTNNGGPGIGCDSRRQLLTRSFVLPFLERGRKRRGGKVWAAGNVLEVVGDSDKQAARTLRDTEKKTNESIL